MNTKEEKIKEETRENYIQEQLEKEWVENMRDVIYDEIEIEEDYDE